MSALAGKTAVILGASGSANFGTAIARRLAAEGANIVVAARRIEPLQALAGELGGTAVACDVTRDGDIENLFRVATQTYGRVDIAVFSAGIHAPAVIAELDAAAIRPTMEVSVIGALLFFRYAAAAMTEGGSVITISSLTARIPGPGLSIYATARAGIDYAIKIAALEYGDARVRFNSIAAGLIQTDMTDAFFAMESVLTGHLDATPCGRMGTLDDMAEAALFLADEQRSGYINGQVLDLAGGQQNGRLPRF
jgi:NAD(P)-dependent dehydrogenase (short-subunit alcohol dehydrogenase family)